MWIVVIDKVNIYRCDILFYYFKVLRLNSFFVPATYYLG
jgi:hypothetical protein